MMIDTFQVEYLGYTLAKDAHEVAVSAEDLGMGRVELNRKIQTMERRIFSEEMQQLLLAEEDGYVEEQPAGNDAWIRLV